MGQLLEVQWRPYMSPAVSPTLTQLGVTRPTLVDMEVSVQEAKARLSRLLRRVEAGEDIVIRRGRQRIEVLTRLAPETSKRRIWGDLSGSMPEDFNATPRDFSGYA